MMTAAWQQYGAFRSDGLTTLTFDPLQDLLWTGNTHGRIASYFIPSQANHDAQLGLWSRYTAFRGHREGPTKQVLVDDKGVLSLSDGSLKLAHRTGRCLWQAFDDLRAASAMCLTSPKSSEVAVAGSQPNVVLINTNSATTVRTAPCAGDITHIERTQAMLCCGSASGSVSFRDPRTLKEEQTVVAHYAGLTQLQTEGNLMITSGFSLKQGNPIPDPLVKVFDVRTFRPLGPIAFPAIPAFVRFHPRTPSTLFITSATGQLSLVDLANPSINMSFAQLDVSSYLTTFAVSSTGEGIAYSDADGSVRLWASAPDPSHPVSWSRSGLEVELPSPVEPPKAVDWVLDTPLSEIGMPFYSQELCSALPEECHVTPYSPMHRPAVSIDPDILANLRIINTVGYAPNPKKTRRNQATPAPSMDKASGQARKKMSVPLFRSEKEKEKEKVARKSRGRQKSLNNIGDEPVLEGQKGSEELEVPKWYRQVEIKYSRFGIEDFDFGFYNRTQHSGLETHIANSYTNALLQLLFYTAPLRKVAISHTTMPCPTPNCILCELGFLFRMLDDAKGVNCQATNFLRAFAANPRVASLNLLDSEEKVVSNRSYSSLIQTCHRFLLDEITGEAATTPAISLARARETGGMRHAPPPATVPSPIAEIFGVSWLTLQTCMACGNSISRPAETKKVLELAYPRKAMSNEAPPPGNFPSILRSSCLRETTSKVACSGCGQATHHRWRRVPAEGGTGAWPPVLAINAAVTTSDQLEYWVDSQTGREGRFLQPSIAVGVEQGGGTMPMVGDGVTAPVPEGEMVVYDLEAMIVQIQADDEPPHLVTLAKVPDKGEGRRARAGEDWYLFNDFLVKKVTEEEALGFPGMWKIPAILYYTRQDAGQILDISLLPATVDISILQQDINMAKRRDVAKKKHQLLGDDELPQRGSLVAIDAEFVSLQEEDVDYRSDGTKVVRRPSRMTLARVSVLRGEGVRTGTPFLDDHIHTSEPIADYLTEFSGIRPGDLDPFNSERTLVPSKVAYKKLRLLVDLGCIFIGHGLSKDFRIINIYVPPDQIIDTVNLYYIPARQRKLSLRLLSHVVLRQDIQNLGAHDSIEDARTALQLYEVYRKWKNERRWEEALEEIYREGREMGWKVPLPESAQVPSPPTQPPSIPVQDYRSPQIGSTAMSNVYAATFSPHPLSPGLSYGRSMFLPGSGTTSPHGPSTAGFGHFGMMGALFEPTVAGGQWMAEGAMGRNPRA